MAAALLALAACDSPAPTAAPAVAAPHLSVQGVSADSADENYIAPLELVEDGEGYFVSGQVIARFRPGASEAQAAAAAGASVKRPMRLARTFVLHVPRGKELSVVRALARNPNVEFAEPDRVMIVTPCEVGNCNRPTDPFLGYKWDLHNTGFVTNSAGTVLQQTDKVDADIDWLEAFDFLGGSFGGVARIGIIDTGIYPDHQDLFGRVIAARNFATGYAATLVKDRNGHGTHVAGIAAARGNNALGVSGVAFGANIRLINAKACDLYLGADGKIVTSCPTSSTSDAIMWATDQGANVLNLSLGGNPAAVSGSVAQRQALQYARARNVLPLCATGNDNYAGVAFPARFPECVAVGSTGWGDARASYSNYGAEVELSAPGGDGNAAKTGNSLILATDTIANSYTWKAGTSMATPQAAGLAALLYATGMTSADAVLARLKSTADDLGAPGTDAQFGAGRINAYRAVTQVDPNAPPVAKVNGPYASTEGATVSFSAAGISPVHTYVDNGSYPVSLTVTDESGLTATATTTAIVANAAPVTSLVLSNTTIFSGQTLTATATATDAGTNDAPWAYAFAWGDGTTATGSVTSLASELAASRTFLRAGTYAVTASVTDKDGAVGTSASATLTVARVQIGIDVRPGSSENPIYWKQPESAKIPVAILGSATLDVRDIVAGSAQLGDMRVAPKKSGGVMAGYEDVNGDGHLDLVLHFERQSMTAQGTLSTATTTLELFADMASGVQLRGQDVVRIIQK
jgi:thermitase